VPENLLLIWAAELAPRAAEMRCAGTGATAQDEGTFGEWLDELPSEVAAANARLLKRTKGTKAPPRAGVGPGAPEPTQGGPGRVTLALRRPLAEPRRYLPVRRCYIA